MSGYVIKGAYPAFDVFVAGEEINRSSDLVSLFRWFATTFQPGDTITWELNSDQRIARLRSLLEAPRVRCLTGFSGDELDLGGFA